MRYHKQINSQPWYQLRNQLSYPLLQYQPRDQLWCYLQDQIQYQLRDQLWIQLKSQDFDLPSDKKFDIVFQGDKQK